MKKGNGWQERIRELTGKLGRFRYPLLILLLGVILLILPGHRDETESDQPQSQPEAEIVTDDMAIEEARLSQLLSQVEGAGKVEVMLSIRTGVETIYQSDTTLRTIAGEEGETQREDTAVLYGIGSGTESPLVRQRAAPIYQGAIVLCQGADDPGVKLALVQAVASLTGLGTDCITVVKME